MAQLVVRNLDDDVKARLKCRAARYSVSMEELVRDILRDAVKRDDEPEYGLGTRIAELFRGIGLEEGEALPELRGSTLKSPFEEQ